jgi:hypothetical protein
MRRLRSLCALALWVVVGCSAPVFTSEEGRFSVRMPGAPEYRMVTVDSADPMPLHKWTVQRGTTTFMVAYADIPVEGREASEILAGARESVLSKPERKLLSERSVSLGGSPGTELEIGGPNGISMRMRIFLVGARLYQILVAGRDQDGFQADETDFLASFKVL